jgi:Mce-associated membrane protein
MTMTSIATKPSFPQRISHGDPLRIAILVVAVLAAISVVLAGLAGAFWDRAGRGESRTVGLAREAVLQDAQRATMTLNTLDYQHVQDGLSRWEQVSTGSLLTQLRANRDSYTHAITDSTTVSTANVLDAAVTTLDERAGSAQVLVAVDVTSQIDKADPGCAHRRVHLDMTRSAGGWKVANLTPVGDTYSELGPCLPATHVK